MHNDIFSIIDIISRYRKTNDINIEKRYIHIIYKTIKSFNEIEISKNNNEYNTKYKMY